MASTSGTASTHVSHQPQFFVHSELESTRSIRLVKVLPSTNRTAPIQCIIEAVDLDKAGEHFKFEAVSYVWGARSGTLPISCNGKTMLVTESCLSALYRLRSRFKTRNLWIDAICIDQTQTDQGLEERVVQIQMMGDVYASASRVIVWLGPAPSLSRAIFLLLKALHAIFRSRPMTGFLVPISYRVADIVARPLRASYDGEDHGKYNEEFVNFLSNPWFARIWTLQEQAMASACVVLWGSASIPWQTLATALLLSSVSIAFDNASYQQAIICRNYASFLVERWPLSPEESDLAGKPSPRALMYRQRELHFLASVLRHQATSVYDKVFGMYAILQELSVDLPKPDYQKPVSVVFEEMTAAWIESRRSVAIIMLAVRPSRSAYELASWVPDWSRGDLPYSTPCENTGFPFFIRGRQDPFFASKSSKTGDEPCRYPGKVALKGVDVGTITKLSTCDVIGDYTAHQEPAMFQELFVMSGKWCRLVDQLTDYPTGEDPFDALRLTLGRPTHHGTDDQAIPGHTYNECLSKFFDLMLWPECRTFDPDLVKEQSGHDDPLLVPYGWYRAVDQFDVGYQMVEAGLQAFIPWANYAFFVLDNGYMGIAFHNIRMGDQVMVLQGADSPMVLRACGDEWEFVAPCYVHGAMEGQLWPDDEEMMQDVLLK